MIRIRKNLVDIPYACWIWSIQSCGGFNLLFLSQISMMEYSREIVLNMNSPVGGYGSGRLSKDLEITTDGQLW